MDGDMKRLGDPCQIASRLVQLLGETRYVESEEIEFISPSHRLGFARSIAPSESERSGLTPSLFRGRDLFAAESAGGLFGHQGAP